jgi:hypothetical protein
MPSAAGDHTGAATACCRHFAGPPEPDPYPALPAFRKQEPVFSEPDYPGAEAKRKLTQRNSKFKITGSNCAALMTVFFNFEF